MDPQNPTGSDAGASTHDPVDMFQNFLDASSGVNEKTNSAATGDEPAGTEDSASDPTDQPSDGDQGNANEPQFTTSHLAKFLGIDENMIDVDGDGQPIFKTKIDGKEGAAKFQEFLKDYQLRGHAENQAREAAEKIQAAERKTQEAEAAIRERHRQIDQHLQQLSEHATALQQELAAEYQQIDWTQLWQTDPGRAGMLRDQFQAKAGRIQTALQKFAADREQNVRAAQTQMQQNAAQAMQREAERLKTLIPEWSDREVQTRESQAIVEWALKSGYDANYLQSLHHGQVPNAAAIVRDMRKAWQHDTLQQKKPEVENKLRAAPKLVKPGTPQQTDAKAVQLKGLKQNIRNATPGTSTKALAKYFEGGGWA
jgi:hypothetical protein